MDAQPLGGTEISIGKISREQAKEYTYELQRFIDEASIGEFDLQITITRYPPGSIGRTRKKEYGEK